MTSSRPTLGVGVVGFGWMGQVHSRAYARRLHHYPAAPLMPRLVAVADTDEARRQMGDLRVAADDRFGDVAWRTVVVAPGAGDLGAFQPGAGIAMGYDDLKVVEAERLVRIAERRSLGATVEDALVAATTCDAIVRSAAERRWVDL